MEFYRSIIFGSIIHTIMIDRISNNYIVNVKILTNHVNYFNNFEAYKQFINAYPFDELVAITAEEYVNLTAPMYIDGLKMTK